MPILYSVISRGTTVLTDHASCVGNFMEVTEQIISKIPLHDDKLTYLQGNYLFHYICENGIIYMCITDDEFERSRAFLYLNEMKRRFLNVNSMHSVDHALAYSMNAEFSVVLAAEMKHYSESSDLDTIAKVHGELDELKDIMVKNINNISERGENLERLHLKTENLTNSSVTFRTTSRNLARTMFWRSMKMYIVIGVVLIIILYFIISMACGGLAWQSCLKKN